MRKQRGWAVFFGVLGGLCLALALCCLLSPAAPESDAPAAPPPARAAVQAWLAPLTTAPENNADAAQPAPGTVSPRSALPGRSAALPRLTRMRDANGHILRAKRYVDSVYLTFRQEDACG